MQVMEVRGSKPSVVQETLETELASATEVKTAQFLLVSHLRLVDRFVVRLLQQLRRWGVEGDRVASLRLALVEAMTNAMEHGNQLQISRRVRVHVEMDTQKIAFWVADEGVGFTAEEINATELNRRFADRGRGILMIKSVMDKVRWRAPGNVLEMVKYR